jgi:hypothetical protein
MRWFQAIRKTEDAKGEWFVYAEEGDQKIEVCIRPLPPGEERRIENKYLGRERKVTFTTEGRQTITNADKNVEYHAERALLALVDTRGADITIGDAGAAELWAKALGESVSVGQTIVLDGRWTKDVKEQAFADAPEVAMWISLKAASLRVRAAKEEAKKEET